ncbi:hypothetical protein N326_05108, partial [Eurypyga helias]
RWDAKEGEDMPYLKDDPDGQRSLGTDKWKSRGEEGAEENCTAELEQKVKQPNFQDPGASSSQRLRSGKVQSAHNGQKEERRGVKGLGMEVSVPSPGDSEPGPKASKEGFGEDASGKPGAADVSKEKESPNSTAAQSSLPSTVQAPRCGSEETLPLPVGANSDGAGLEKNMASEQESTGDSSNGHRGELELAAGDRLDAGEGQLGRKRGEEV